MATRLNPRTAESVKQRIQVSKLIDALQDHVNGKNNMSPTQIDAAKFLINKRMPNPPQKTKTELSGKVKAEIVQIARFTPAPE